MTAGSGCSPDPPKAASELANTTTGLVPRARHEASSASVPRRLVRMPRSKSASHSQLTAAARWKITSAPASVSGPARSGSSSSPSSPRTPATRSSAARSAGTAAWSTSVTRASGRAPAPATSSDPAASRVRARREPRKPEPPVTTTFSTAPTIAAGRSGLVEDERAVPRRPGGLVGRDDHAGARAAAAGQPQRGRPRAVAEELLAAPEVHGILQQPVLVDQVVIDERLRQLAAAVNLQLVPGLLLEPGDLGGQVAAEHRGVVPVGGGERGRRHVLRQRVELARDWVVGIGDLGPVAAEDLVRLAAEQERVGAAEPAGDGLAEILVAVRERPAPVFEPAVAVLVRPAGRLHDAVEGEESVQGQSHRVSSSVRMP